MSRIPTATTAASRYSAAGRLASDDVSAWQDRAACREVDPDLFFPVGRGPLSVAQAEEAKGFCRRCPVIAECEEFRVRIGAEAGVWAGRSEEDREAAARRAARARRAGA